MNDLIMKVCDDIALSERKDTAKELYRFFRTVKPQFYKNQTEQEMIQEIASIQMLTASIPLDRLAEMCRLAVENYPRRKAENPKEVFNIDYLLSFKQSAKDKLHPQGFCIIIDYDAESKMTTYGDIDYLTDNFDYPDNAPRFYEKD